MSDTSATNSPLLNMSDEQFARFRYLQDDPVDGLAERIIHYDNYMHLFRSMKNIERNDQEVTADIFKALRVLPDKMPNELEQEILDYFNNKELFFYTDEEIEQIKKGCECFYIAACSGLIILCVRSLMKQYAAYNACQVLASTKMLNDYPHRRILETTQFVLDLMDPEEWNPEGRAIRSIQKLRLVHAMIRARIKHQKNLDYPWNPEEWGLPINQQDMLFATNTFSVEVVDGYRTAGYEFETNASLDDYYLTWHYIGRGLGLLDQLNPSTYEDGKAVQQRIYDNEFQDNNQLGKDLTDACISFVDELIPGPPGKESWVYALIKVYNDPSEYWVFTDILGIPLDEASEKFENLFRAALKGDNIRVEQYESEFDPKVLDWVWDIVNDNFDLMNRYVQLSKSWRGSSFEVGDGFGDKIGRYTSYKNKLSKTIPGQILKAGKMVVGMGLGLVADGVQEIRENAQERRANIREDVKGFREKMKERRRGGEEEE